MKRFSSKGTDGQDSKRWKRPVLCPSRVELMKLIKSDPGRIFYDAHGRAYGLMPSDNTLTLELTLSGEINESQKLFWVYLPSRVEGIWLTPQLRKELLRTEQSPLYLPDPDAGETITLYNLLSYKPVLVLLSGFRYVEHFPMQRRSAALLADVYQLVRNPFVTTEDISKEVEEHRIRILERKRDVEELKTEPAPLKGLLDYTYIKPTKQEEGTRRVRPKTESGIKREVP